MKESQKLKILKSAKINNAAKIAVLVAMTANYPSKLSGEEAKYSSSFTMAKSKYSEKIRVFEMRYKVSFYELLMQNHGKRLGSTQASKTIDYDYMFQNLLDTKFGYISFKSTPAGADIEVNGEVQNDGKTNTKLLYEVGTYSCKIIPASDPSKACSKDIEVEDGLTKEFLCPESS